MDVCLLWVLCGRSRSASGRPLLQRSPTECVVCMCDREASRMRRPWPTGGCRTTGKIYILHFRKMEQQLFRFSLWVWTLYVALRGSSDGIATDYRLDDPGIESRCGEIFCHSRPALWPTQLPVQWVPSLSRGQNTAGACCWALTPSSAAVMEE